MNGSRKPAASPTSSQPGPARRVTRWPSGQAPATASVGVAVAPRGRVVGRRRDGGDDRVGDGARAVPGERRPPRAAEHDPDVDPAAGHRRDPDVAVAQHPHPGVAAAGRIGVGQVVGQPDPRVEPDRPGDTGRPGDDRVRPVGADDDRRPHAIRAAVRRRAPPSRPARQVRRRSRSSRGGPRRRPPTARSSRTGSSRDRSNPTAGSPPVSAP